MSGRKCSQSLQSEKSRGRGPSSALSSLYQKKKYFFEQNTNNFSVFMALLLKVVSSCLKHERKLVGIFFLIPTEFVQVYYFSGSVRKVVNKVSFFLIEGKCILKLFLLHI